MNKSIVSRNYGKKQSLIIFIGLSVFLFYGVTIIFTSSQSFAADKVRGAYYDITGVPLLNASDEIVARSELKIGKKVEIFFKNNRITAIIYGRAR